MAEAGPAALASSAHLARSALVYEEGGSSGHHYPGGSHPEQPARTTALWAELCAEGLAGAALRVPARLATEDEICLVHERSHWRRLEEVVRLEASELRRWCERQDSLYLNGAASLTAARLACGSLLALTEEVMAGRARNGLAVVRPPGHHAERHRAMGFCVINSVAAAAAHARAALGARRVLIVDWDIHHGNGIQRAFEADPSVLYFSVHRSERGTFFPADVDVAGAGYAAEMSPSGVGKGVGEGTSVNVGWNTRGSASRPGDAEYLAVWDELLLPIATEFSPDLVIVAAGYDAAEGDPLGGCHVTPAGYHALTRRLMRLAGGRLVVALEGGYSISATAACGAATMAALLGLDSTPSAAAAAAADAAAADAAAAAAAASAEAAAAAAAAAAASAEAAAAAAAFAVAAPASAVAPRRGGRARAAGDTPSKEAPATPVGERAARELKKLAASAGAEQAQSSREARAAERQAARLRLARDGFGQGGDKGTPSARRRAHEGSAAAAARRSIDEAKAVQRRYWRCLQP